MQRSNPLKKPVVADEGPMIPKKRAKKKRYIFLKTLLFILVCMVVFMLSALYGYRYIMNGYTQADQAIPAGQGQIIKIPYGSSTTDIAAILQKEGYVGNTSIFKLISKIMGFDSVYKAGKFEISKGMNYYALMLVLAGDPIPNPTKDIMIPEGKTLIETAQTLGDQGYLDADTFKSLCEKMPTQYLFLKDLAVSPDRKYPLEGYLYPDTYKMDEGWTEQQLIDRMLTEFDSNFTQQDYDQAKKLGLTIDQVVTLASIIEMEAKYPSDLKKISSVFHNRLKIGMPLQSDATIQYARIEQGIGRTSSVLYKDTEMDDPYNTYKYPGLPPGPICSPRKDSIEAALFPDDTKYLYFFATPDGVNIYNETLEGHMSDQQKYGVSGN